jgi:hypothetical protein
LAIAPRSTAGHIACLPQIELGEKDSEWKIKMKHTTEVEEVLFLLLNMK